MASTFVRSANRTALSALRSRVTKSTAALRPTSAAKAAPFPIRRRSPLSSRFPGELGCCAGSLLPLHSAVAQARLTCRLSTATRSCRDILQGTLCRTYPGL